MFVGVSFFISINYFLNIICIQCQFDSSVAYSYLVTSNPPWMSSRHVGSWRRRGRQWVWYHHTIPYHPMKGVASMVPHHTTPYHTIPHHTIPYHTIPLHERGRQRVWMTSSDLGIHHLQFKQQTNIIFIIITGWSRFIIDFLEQFWICGCLVVKIYQPNS